MIKRVQFNEIRLWSGTRLAVEGLDDEGQELDAYQAFGDMFIRLGHDFSKVTDYRPELDIDRAAHQVTDPNLFDSHPPFQIDGEFGATAGFCEMRVQSHAGRIHLLPALPKAWPSGEVTGLCARGGLKVEMSWDDGRLSQAVTHSKSGLPCKVVCGDRSWEFNTKVGKSYPLALAQKVDPRSSRYMGRMRIICVGFHPAFTFNRHD